MAKPSVDGLEEDLGDAVAFTRVNITQDAGRSIANKYGIRGVPAFVLLSSDGEVLYKKVGGLPGTSEITELVAQQQQ